MIQTSGIISKLASCLPLRPSCNFYSNNVNLFSVLEEPYKVALCNLLFKKVGHKFDQLHSSNISLVSEACSLFRHSYIFFVEKCKLFFLYTKNQLNLKLRNLICSRLTLSRTYEQRYTQTALLFLLQFFLNFLGIDSVSAPSVFYDPQLQFICCYIARFYVKN